MQLCFVLLLLSSALVNECIAWSALSGPFKVQNVPPQLPTMARTNLPPHAPPWSAPSHLNGATFERAAPPGCSTKRRTSTRLSLLASSGDTDSWREYVPLAVSCLVILDILLGSPFVNLVLSPMRRQAEMTDNGSDPQKDQGGVTMKNLLEKMGGGATDQQGTNRKERVDSQQVAKEALDRAENAMELRNYLERQKTDWDRMEELRKKMDNQMEELEDNLQNLEKPKQQDRRD